MRFPIPEISGSHCKKQNIEDFTLLTHSIHTFAVNCIKSFSFDQLKLTDDR